MYLRRLGNGSPREWRAPAPAQPRKTMRNKKEQSQESKPKPESEEEKEGEIGDEKEEGHAQRDLLGPDRGSHPQKREERPPERNKRLYKAERSKGGGADPKGREDRGKKEGPQGRGRRCVTLLRKELYRQSG